MEEADYPGVRVSMETKFDGVITPLKIDISTGDVITPREIKYKFNLMLEDRTCLLYTSCLSLACLLSHRFCCVWRSAGFLFPIQVLAGGFLFRVSFLDWEVLGQ